MEAPPSFILPLKKKAQILPFSVKQSFQNFAKFALNEEN